MTEKEMRGEANLLFDPLSALRTTLPKRKAYNLKLLRREKRKIENIGKGFIIKHQIIGL